jgi:hypothetical protein
MAEVLLRHLPGGTELRQETNLLGQHMYRPRFEVNISRIQAWHVGATENRSARRMFFCIDFEHRPWIL